MNSGFAASRPIEKLLFGAAALAGTAALLALPWFGVPASAPGFGAAAVHTLWSVLLIALAFGTPLIAVRSRLSAGALLVLGSSVVAVGLLDALARSDAQQSAPGPVFWCQLVGAWLLAWAAVEQLSRVGTRSPSLPAPLRAPLRHALGLLMPLLFGTWLLLLWECLVRGLDVPQVLLPPPSMIAERFVTSPSILWADFQQTFLKSVLVGWAIGCSVGFLIALAIDRSPFLQRGLLPIGNLASALPIVGLAPIMVMWFGFDWPSKVAVVVVMTFFPMLVNTTAGLAATAPMQRDLMRTWGADYRQTLWRLRLPAAMPFVFNALKINSTLALIGAIVAEFFGTPIVGMGFRISTEVGRMNVDMVWAEIAVAAVAGSLFYGVLALLERRITHWHPSMRAGAIG